MASFLRKRSSAAMTGSQDGKDINEGTSQDMQEMSLMNKIQEFSRDFGTLALTCFGLITNSSWPYAFFNMSLPLSNGGPAGMLWMTIIAAVGIFMCDLSLAEMASMTPSSAGPYQWTAEVAPESCQKVLSFVVGWFDVLGWQAAVAFSAYLIAANVQGLLFLFDASYVPQNFHLTLLMIASIVITILVATRSTIVLRHCSWIMGILFMAVWLFICITLAVLAPHPTNGATRRSLALDFQNANGWSSPGAAALVGILGPISTFVGGDVSCHMSEETENASLAVPRAIYRSALTGYIMTILTTILLLYSLGPDVSSLLESPSGQPYQQVFLNATGDETKTVVMVVFMMLLLFFSQITTTTASSRQMFTFARDNGLPFSRFLSKITPRTHIPWNSVMLTFVIVCLLSLIPLGSLIAFNIITSLSSIAIFASYWISIACRLGNRFSSNPIQPPRWNMGVAGIFVNIAALIFLSLGIVMVCFPSAPDPDAAAWNWTSVIFWAL